MSSPEEVELNKTTISELTPFARNLEVTFVVIDKGEPRTVVSRKSNEEHTVADIKVGDTSGCITLTLWDDNIEKVGTGDTYVVKNGYVNIFQNKMRLALGKYGHLEDTEEEIDLESVDVDNDRSDDYVEDPRRSRRRSYGGGGFSRQDRGGYSRRGGGDDRSRGRRRW